MRNNPLIIFFLIFIFPAGLIAQSLETDIYARPVEPVIHDTVAIQNSVFYSTTESVITTDSIISENNVIPADSTSSEKECFKPNPEKVIWLGAIIPGFGQIVNKKYWKLPIVYGGFMGCGFAITWFSKEYNFYNIAYRDIMDDDPTTSSHLDFLSSRYGTTDMSIVGGASTYSNNLKSYRDNYRRYRDLSILVSIIYYGLTVLEAYVDAQLYDFDISPDLTMRFQPAIINNDVGYAKTPNDFDAFGQKRVIGNSNAIGIQWNIRLK